MAVLVNSVEISAPAEAVFDYASDLANELEWGEPMRIAKVTQGPVGVGTRFDAEWKGSGRIDVEYIGMERPRSWAALGHGSRMDVNLSAALKLMMRMIKRLMQKTEEKNVAALKTAIERRAAGLGARS